MDRSVIFMCFQQMRTLNGSSVYINIQEGYGLLCCLTAEQNGRQGRPQLITKSIFLECVKLSVTPDEVWRGGMGATSEVQDGTRNFDATCCSYF
jgi:hypothetical protein